MRYKTIEYASHTIKNRAHSKLVHEYQGTLKHYHEVSDIILRNRRILKKTLLPMNDYQHCIDVINVMVKELYILSNKLRCIKLRIKDVNISFQINHGPEGQYINVE